MGGPRQRAAGVVSGFRGRALARAPRGGCSFLCGALPRAGKAGGLKDCAGEGGGLCLPRIWVGTSAHRLLSEPGPRLIIYFLYFCDINEIHFQLASPAASAREVQRGGIHCGPVLSAPHRPAPPPRPRASPRADVRPPTLILAVRLARRAWQGSRRSRGGGRRLARQGAPQGLWMKPRWLCWRGG